MSGPIEVMAERVVAKAAKDITAIREAAEKALVKIPEQVKASQAEVQAFVTGRDTLLFTKGVPLASVYEIWVRPTGEDRITVEFHSRHPETFSQKTEQFQVPISPKARVRIVVTEEP